MGRFGLLVDAGLPEGLAIGISYRPVRAIRLWAGPAWNYIAWGVHGGVALVPYSSIIAPSISVEAGHFFAADLSHTVDAGAPPEVARRS